MFEIKTEGLILRDFRQADIVAYQALRDDEKFLRFYSEDDASAEKAGSLVKMFIEQSRQIPRTKYQLAVFNKNHELMGSCGVREEAPRVYSIGCEIGRRWHGSGVAREAGHAMVNFAFSELRAEKIFAETISENSAAIRLCRSLGMVVQEVRTNDRHFKGRYWNTSVLSMSRADWDESVRESS